MRINFFIEKEAPPHKVQQRFLDVSRAVNGNIGFGNPQNGSDNINGSWQELVTPGVVDTEFTLTHNLGRIPTGMVVVSLDQAAIVYASRKNQWTITQAFFKVNQASVALTGFII